jgi:Double zinc ribbon
MVPLFDILGSDGWSLARNAAVVVLVLLWLATAYWTFKDARRRIEDPRLIGVATVVGLIPPFLGPVIYMFFRPPEYLQDARERELEIKAMEERIAQLDQRCPVCRARVEPSFLVCPVCTTRLRQACAACGQPLEALWQVCPHCATPVTPALPLLEDVSSKELPAPRTRASE